MARFVNIAAVHFQVSEQGKDPRETALRQFREAEALLDGTKVDLVVTCEGMEAVGQSMEEAEHVSKPGPFLEAYQSFAKRNRTTVAGSIKWDEDGKVFNALVFVGPDGAVLGDYRKSFPTSGELGSGIAVGPGAKVVDTPAGRLGGVICFDLNFDDLRDQYHALKPDILCFSSMFHGGHLQKNWAYQCRAFFAGACKDNTSDILDPLGRVLHSTNFYQRIASARVNLDRFFMHLDDNHQKFPEMRRKYQDRILIDTSPELGVAVLYSLDGKITALQMAAEFGLVHIDEYFSTSRKAALAAL
ncbi:MAG: carbon-nitrogen hydrolase family protein [Spirochaetia bacterium]|nr:carbon-nitrogen hydrolase family protein [Spirochaetia bacterium]